MDGLLLAIDQALTRTHGALRSDSGLVATPQGRSAAGLAACTAGFAAGYEDEPSSKRPGLFFICAVLTRREIGHFSVYLPAVPIFSLLLVLRFSLRSMQFQFLSTPHQTHLGDLYAESRQT